MFQNSWADTKLDDPQKYHKENTKPALAELWKRFILPRTPGDHHEKERHRWSSLRPISQILDFF